jgi:hypothetical protein
MSQHGCVTELPDGSLQYQERTNYKPWNDPYPEIPNSEENARRSAVRAYARQDRAIKEIAEYVKMQQQKNASAQKVTPSSKTGSTPKASPVPKTTSSKSATPKLNLFSKFVSKK